MSNPNPDVASTPCSPNTDDGDSKSFPFELLPNEMRVPILENIHDPRDKLNVVKALPSTACLMGWEYTYLQFEVIYPFVYPYLKWPYDEDSRSWKHVLNLCKVSPALNGIVLRHYEKYLHLSHNPERTVFRHRGRQEQIWTNDPLKKIPKATSKKTSPPWTTILPFGIATKFTAGGQVQVLKKLGAKLWSLEMSLVGAYHQIPGIIDYTVQCLHLVPDLRRLGLADLYPNQDGDGEEGPPPVVLRGAREGIVLPELPYLKNITLIGDCPSIQEWILPKYTRQLETLDFYDCYLTENFNPTCFPKVESIRINFIPDKTTKYLAERTEYKNASIDKVNDLLNKFSLSPLKELNVRLEKWNVTKFFNFMLTLNHFGKTLDTLEMKFGRMDSALGVEYKNEIRGWISQLKFPKLSCLFLGRYVGPLEFLLQMPALENLVIFASNLDPINRSNVSGLRFSLKKKVMLESSMWQLFPKLDWFLLKIVTYNQDGTLDLRTSRRRDISLTRKCYEKHQKNKKH